jgi:hypothetical protein
MDHHIFFGIGFHQQYQLLPGVQITAVDRTLQGAQGLQ